MMLDWQTLRNTIAASNCSSKSWKLHNYLSPL